MGPLQGAVDQSSDAAFFKGIVDEFCDSDVGSSERTDMLGDCKGKVNIPPMLQSYRESDGYPREGGHTLVGPAHHG